MIPPQQPEKKRHPVRMGCLGLVGLVVLVIIIVSAVAASSGGHSSPPASAPARSASAAAATPAAHVPGLGTAVYDGKFRFMVNSVSSAKSAGDTADGLGATAQGEYTVLHIVVTNIGTEAQSLSDSAQVVYDGAGRKYAADSSADIYFNETGNAPLFESINPGNSVAGLIAFDLPAGDTAVRAELHDSVFSGGVAVRLK